MISQSSIWGTMRSFDGDRGAVYNVWEMKSMKKTNAAGGGQGGVEIFENLVKTVFLFIHQHYGEFNAVLQKYEINYSQYAAILSVYMYGSLSEGDLARMLFVNPSTVSRMVYALEEKGWLESTRDKADRRKVLVRLSPTGKRKIAGMLRQPAEVLAGFADNLEEEKRVFVYNVIEQINQALSYLMAKDEDAGG